VKEEKLRTEKKYAPEQLIEKRKNVLRRSVKGRENKRCNGATFHDLVLNA
jgi:hypothetical protein